MYVGLVHLHKSLAYLIFLATLLDLVLALTKARSDARMAKVMHWVHTVGVMGAGRLTLVVGLGMMFAGPQPLTQVWPWIGILLWGPIEVAAKRMIKPEIQTVRDGGQGSGRLAGGAALQLLCIVVIFGLMTVRPL